MCSWFCRGMSSRGSVILLHMSFFIGYVCMYVCMYIYIYVCAPVFLDRIAKVHIRGCLHANWKFGGLNFGGTLPRIRDSAEPSVAVMESATKRPRKKGTTKKEDNNSRTARS